MTNILSLVVLFVFVIGTLSVSYYFFGDAIWNCLNKRSFLRNTIKLTAIALIPILGFPLADAINFLSVSEKTIGESYYCWLILVVLIPVCGFVNLVLWTGEEKRDADIKRKDAAIRKLQNEIARQKKHYVQLHEEIEKDSKHSVALSHSQLNSFTSLLKHIRHCVEKYSEFICKDIYDVRNTSGYVKRIDRLKPSETIGLLLLDSIRSVFRDVAISRSYQTDIPTSARFTCTLLVEEEGYLAHYYSSDGTKRDIFEAAVKNNKAFFKLTNQHQCSAVKSVETGIVRIVGDTNSAHKSSSANDEFTFIQSASNQRLIQSLVCIPLDLVTQPKCPDPSAIEVIANTRQRAVLCVSCDRKNAFDPTQDVTLAEEVKLQLETRLNLLQSQELLFKTIKHSHENVEAEINAGWDQKHTKVVKGLRTRIQNLST